MQNDKLKSNELPLVDEIQFIPVRPNNGLIGFISFILNQSFKVADVALHTRPTGGVRLVYPTRKLANGMTVPSFHPIKKAVNDHINLVVNQHYENLTRKFEDIHDKFKYSAKT